MIFDTHSRTRARLCGSEKHTGPGTDDTKKNIRAGPCVCVCAVQPVQRQRQRRRIRFFIVALFAAEQLLFIVCKTRHASYAQQRDKFVEIRISLSTEHTSFLLLNTIAVSIRYALNWHLPFYRAHQFDWIFAIINCVDDELSGQLNQKMTAATRTFSHGTDVCICMEKTVFKCKFYEFCAPLTQLTAERWIKWHFSRWTFSSCWIQRAQANCSFSIINCHREFKTYD